MTLPEKPRHASLYSSASPRCALNIPLQGIDLQTIIGSASPGTPLNRLPAGLESR
jgi:hypothetical protein